MKKDFVMPIVILTAICLFISAALAITNYFTEPIIVKAAAERAEAARNEAIPEAEGFELIALDGAPATIKEVYKTTNDVGYIFMITTAGYGGEMKLICAIDNDGNIITCKVLAQSETKGLGSRITEEAFAGQFPGKNSALEGVSTLTGATISSKAYVNAVKDAFAAFELVKEAQS
jgi:electron transport complex protein RnfG